MDADGARSQTALPACDADIVYIECSAGSETRRYLYVISISIVGDDIFRWFARFFPQTVVSITHGDHQFNLS